MIIPVFKAASMYYDLDMQQDTTKCTDISW